MSVCVFCVYVVGVEVQVLGGPADSLATDLTALVEISLKYTEVWDW